MRPFRKCFRWPLSPPISLTRQIRTLRGNTGNPDVTDVDAQLSGYSPEQKAAILDQMKRIDPVDKENQLSLEEYNEALLKDSLQLADSPSDLPNTFWRSVKNYIKTKHKTVSPDTLEFLIYLFECAKEIPSPQLRESMLFELGRQVYRKRLVRFDPDNELLFLDSLVANNRAAYAVQLWNARKNREDVADSLQWKQNGVTYLTNAGRISQASSLLFDMLKHTTYVPTETLVPVFNAYALQVRRGRGGLEARRALKSLTESIQKTAPERHHSDNAAILHALIISRQWGLASQVLSDIPSQFLTEPEQSSAIERALTISATSQADFETEAQFEDFFATLSNANPLLGVSPLTLSALALSFAARQDIESASEVIFMMSSREMLVPRKFQVEIVKQFMNTKDYTFLQNPTIASLVRDPQNLARILQRCDREQAHKLVKSVQVSDLSLTPELAFRLLSKHLVTLESAEDLSKYGQFPASQSYLWYMCAMNKLNIFPENLGMELPDVETLVYICQAFVRREADFRTAVHQMFALFSSTQPAATPAQAAVIHSTLQKLQSGRLLPLRPPSYKPNLGQAGSGGSISWSTVAKPFLQTPSHT